MDDINNKIINNIDNDIKTSKNERNKTFVYNTLKTICSLCRFGFIFDVGEDIYDCYTGLKTENRKRNYLEFTKSIFRNVSAEKQQEMLNTLDNDGEVNEITNTLFEAMSESFEMDKTRILGTIVKKLLLKEISSRKAYVYLDITYSVFVMDLRYLSLYESIKPYKKNKLEATAFVKEIEDDVSPSIRLSTLGLLVYDNDVWVSSTPSYTGPEDPENYLIQYDITNLGEDYLDLVKESGALLEPSLIRISNYA